MTSLVEITVPVCEAQSYKTLVARLGAGETLYVDRAGNILERIRPPPWPEVSPSEGFGYDAAGYEYRLFVMYEGRTKSRFVQENLALIVRAVRSIRAAERSSRKALSAPDGG